SDSDLKDFDEKKLSSEIADAVLMPAEITQSMYKKRYKQALNIYKQEHKKVCEAEKEFLLQNEAKVQALKFLSKNKSWMLKAQKHVKEVLALVHAEYKNEDATISSIANIKKEFVTDKEIKKMAVKEEMTARKAHKQVAGNST
ncbi:MAG: hypothetical protein Q9224_006264, partial [Gallowayella concinna]